MRTTEGHWMTTSSEIRQRFGLDDGWTVRFTADRPRARDVAQGYRRAGYDVRTLALAPDGDDLDVETVEAVDAEYDPVTRLREEDCTVCLEDAYVVLTRAAGDPEGDDDLVYE